MPNTAVPLSSSAAGKEHLASKVHGVLEHLKLRLETGGHIVSRLENGPRAATGDDGFLDSFCFPEVGPGPGGAAAIGDLMHEKPRSGEAGRAGFHRFSDHRADVRELRVGRLGPFVHGTVAHGLVTYGGVTHQPYDIERRL